MKYLVGMSGGVDSSFVAMQLKAQGHTVAGATLLMHEHTELARARAAAQQLDVPLYEIDCRAAFEDEVVAPFVRAYQNGKTPNPCVLCNRAVKVGALCDFARENGFDAVVTGHYAKIGRAENGRYYVACAQDQRKDQSYMLWRLTQEQLSLLQTPLGEIEKEALREQALACGLESAQAKDSQDICFLPDGDYVSFLEARIGKMPKGSFVYPDGTVVGEHKGIYHYTVGQRKGLGLACNQRVFVCAIDPVANTVTVAPTGGEYAQSLCAADLNFVAFTPPQKETTARLRVKIRYAAKPTEASVTYTKERMEIHFDTPERAVTPGQSVVCYDGDRIAFGGIIE